MEITTLMVAKLYLATFGRPLDSRGLEYWTNTGEFAGGTGTTITTMEGLAASFAVQTEFTTSYPSTMTTTEFVTAIYDNLLGRVPDAEGLGYWVDKLDGTNNSGLNTNLTTDSKDAFILIFINGAQDSVDGNDLTLINNRADVALYVAEQGTLTEDMAKDASVIAQIIAVDGDSDATAVAAAKTAADTAVVEANSAPVLATMDAVSTTENVTLTSGTVVATAAATDANTGDTITYSISGDDRFTIDSATGAISVVADTTFDYETETSVTLTVSATDGIADAVTTEVVVNVTNLEASYALAADAETAIDGDTVNFTFTTTNVAESDLTEVTYTISGVNAADVVGGKLTGTATVDANGEATVSVTLLATASNTGKTVTASIDGMELTDTTTVTNGTTPTETTVSLNDILGADDSYLLYDAGDTTPALYTVGSNGDITGADAKISVSGAANVTVNAGTGDDTIAVNGTGNNVVNAGAGTDTVLLSTANNVVIIEDGEWDFTDVAGDGADGDDVAGEYDANDTGSAIYGDADGVNTIVVSGTNDLTTGTITNVTNLVLEADANVTITEDFLADLTSLVANGTNSAKLTVTTGENEDTIDLTTITVGSLSKLTLGANVEVKLSAEQIASVTTFVLDETANIVTSAEGAALLAEKGIDPSIDGGEATLLSATTDNLAAEEFVDYEINAAAKELVDQLYLLEDGEDDVGLAGTQITDENATVNVTDTATVAQAETINAKAAAIGSTYAVADTAANIFDSIDGEDDAWLNAEEISSLTITTAATVEQATAIFADDASLDTAVTDAAADEEDDLVITTPTYTITDSADNMFGEDDAILDIVSDAESVSILTTDNEVTKAQATKLVALSNFTGTYDLVDTAAAIYAANETVRNTATNIELTEGEVANVTQAARIATYNNSGDFIYALEDSAAALNGATTALLEAATAVTITGDDNVLTVAQATKLAPYLTEAFTLTDTGANLTSEAGLALIAEYNDTITVAVKSTDQLTIAEAITLEAAIQDVAVADVVVDDIAAVYDIKDSAENILAELTATETDSLGQNEAATARATVADAIIDDVLAADGVTVEATGTVTIAQAADLVVGTTYNVSDTAETIAADLGDTNLTLAATEVTITTAGSLEDITEIATALTANDPVIDMPAYSIEEEDLATIVDAFVDVVDGDDEDGTSVLEEAAFADLLNNATSITITDSTVLTLAQAEALSILNELLDTDLEYAIETTVVDITTVDDITGDDTGDQLSEVVNDTTNVDTEATEVTFSDVITNATSATIIDTAAEIITDADSLKEDATTNTVYTKFDGYIVSIASDGIDGADYNATAYTNADAIEVTVVDSTLANAATAYTFLEETTLGLEDKTTFDAITEDVAVLAADDLTDAEIATIGKTTTVTVGDDVTVVQANTISNMVNGTFVIDTSITDTAANLLTLDATVLAAIKAGGATVNVDGNATIAQAEALLDMLETAEIIARDADTGVLTAPAATLVMTILDSITNVQAASTDLLAASDTTNTITLTAGSEVSFTVAQANAVADLSTDIILASDGETLATYEIVDTIENLTLEGAGDLLEGASTIISIDGTITDVDGIDGGYIDTLQAVVIEQDGDAADNFNDVNSVYNVSMTAAEAAADVDDAIAQAATVTITDAVDIDTAVALLEANENTTLTGITDAYTDLFTTEANDDEVEIATGLVAQDEDVTTTLEAITAAGNVITLTDTDVGTLSVAQIQSVLSVLGEDVAVTYEIADTAANLAAATDLLANASAVTVNADEDGVNATVAQAAAIVAASTYVDADGEGITVTYTLTDTAAAIAAADATLVLTADAVEFTTDATMAEAMTIETVFASEDGEGLDLDIDVVDTAANVAASITALEAIVDEVVGEDDENFDTGADVDHPQDSVTITTTATMAQTAAIVDSCPVYTLDSVKAAFTGAEVEADASTVGCVVEDTAANIIAGTIQGAAQYIVVSDAVNVSEAAQIADAYSTASDDVDDRDAALDLMTYDISDAQTYIINAFTEDNNILGAANSISTTEGATFTVGQIDNADNYFIQGSVEELSALPAELLEVGFIIIDSIENYNNAIDLQIHENVQGYKLVDTSANVLLASASVTTGAAEVQITDVVDSATFTELNDLGLDLTTVAGVSDTAENLAALTLTAEGEDDTPLAITTVTVTDETITMAEAAEIDGLGEGYVYTISDEYANVEFDNDNGHLDFYANAQAVTITGDLTTEEAGVVYAKNANLTITIEDSAANIIDGIDNEDTDAGNAATDLESDALAIATTISLDTDTAISVDDAAKLVALTGFDGVYTIVDSAADLVEADTTLLANAVEVQVDGDVTVAQAEVISTLTNIALDDDDLQAYVISDTAAAISAADATLLDNVAAIAFDDNDADTDTDTQVTAAQAASLQVLIDNEDVVGLTTDGDTFDVVDTYANVILAANDDAVSSAATVTVTDTISVAQGDIAFAINEAITLDIEDTTTNAIGAGDTVAVTDSLTITDDTTASFASSIKDYYGAISEYSFAKLTGAYDDFNGDGEVTIAEATTVDLTGAYAVADLAGIDGTGILTVVGDKLVGGYDIQDSVDNIVNAVLNNDYSAAVAQGAADVSLTEGEETMNIAASSVITTLNFSGNYNISDTSANVATGTTELINGADLVTINGIATKETITLTDYTTAIVLDQTTNGTTDISVYAEDDANKLVLTNVDTIVGASADNLTIVLAETVTTLDDNFDSGNDEDFTNLEAGQYSLIQGNATGLGFATSDTGLSTMLVYTVDAATDTTHGIVLSGVTDASDFTIVSGKGTDAADDIVVLQGAATIDGGLEADNITLADGSQTLVISDVTNNGNDVITGFATEVDKIQLSATDLNTLTAASTFAAGDVLGTDAGAFVSAATGDIAAALTATATFIYDETLTTLSFDADGSGVAAAIVIGTLDAVAAEDFIFIA